MTEAEWDDCTDSRKMLAFLRGKASGRKLRLFAVACCRRIDRHFKDQRSRQLIDAAELFADGVASPGELGAAFEAAAEAQGGIYLQGGGAVDQGAAEAVLGLRQELLLDQVLQGVGEAVGEHEAAKVWESIHKDWVTREREHREACEAGEAAERVVQADLLRDIFGWPLRPLPAVAPGVLGWRDGLVVKLAQAAYNERAMPEGVLDPARLAILADALEEAGCSDAEILGHLRGPGPHTRGCRVLDLLLGKERTVDGGTWPSCTDPQAMLTFLRGAGPVSDRKLRLFAVACCRRVWTHLSDRRNRRVIELAERHADDETAGPELQAALQAVEASGDIPSFEGKTTDAELLSTVTAGGIRAAAALAVVTSASHDPSVAELLATVVANLAMPSDPNSGVATRAAHADLIRDIFGVPFKSVSIDPSCRTQAVVRLALAAYKNRTVSAGHLDLNRLALLADALEEAGCTAAEILAHLRGPGPHVRGCHIVDLLLTKE
jgi:hypothetical protein